MAGFLSEADAEVEAASEAEVRASGSLKQNGPTAKLVAKQAVAQAKLPQLERELRSLASIVNELEAQAQSERTREVVAKGEALREAQTEALAAFGQWFEHGRELWDAYAGTVRELDAHWRANRQVYIEEAAPHVLRDGAFPTTFASLLRLAGEAVHREWNWNGHRSPLAAFVSDSLPPEEPLEVAGILERIT